MEVDKILLDLYALGVILGINWLIANDVSMDCYKKEVTLKCQVFPVVVLYLKY